MARVIIGLLFYLAQSLTLAFAGTLSRRDGDGIPTPAHQRLQGSIGRNRADVEHMHGWWCEKYATSPICEWVNAKKKGDVAKIAPPSAEEVLKMHHEYCHAGLDSSGDHFVTTPLPINSSSFSSAIASHQQDLSFGHALPVPASSSAAKHSGRFSCKAHDVDRMQAWWCRSHPSSHVCSVLAHRRSAFATLLLARFGGDRSVKPAKYEGDAPAPEELHRMHEEWCEFSNQASSEPCRRWSEVKGGNPVARNTQDSGAHDNSNKLGSDLAPFVPRYQRTPHF